MERSEIKARVEEITRKAEKDWKAAFDGQTPGKEGERRGYALANYVEARKDLNVAVLDIAEGLIALAEKLVRYTNDDDYHQKDEHLTKIADEVQRDVTWGVANLHTEELTRHALRLAQAQAAIDALQS